VSYSLSELNSRGVPSLVEGLQDVKEWMGRRERILSEWLNYVEELPGNRGAVRWETLSEEEEECYVRLRIRYTVSDGDEVPAILLVPKAVAGGGSGKAPAVLALHPTAEAGKGDVATPAGRDNRRYGVELAERGYVVLAPDVIAFGERVFPGAQPYMTAPFYEQRSGWTAVGKMLFDHMHGLDLLESLPFVDADRIGAIGHSLGGYNAYFLAGLDRRVKAIAVSCGFTVFAGDPEPNRWGQREWFSHIPRISADLAEGRVPFEHHEIAALVAPTPFFNWNGTLDHIFPNWQRISEACAAIDELYRFLGAEGRFSYLWGNSGHDFPANIRESAYTFLDRHLKL